MRSDGAIAAGWDTGLVRRAQLHAALAEPARLAMVDHLRLTDASPGELGTAFGLATNLLAHHVRVLQDAGLVRRVRSQADARRAYLQLRLDDRQVADLIGAPGWPAGPPGRVLFICARNSARSQLAAAVWRRFSPLPAASAGTRPEERVHPGAIEAGRRHGLRLGRARTAHLAHVLELGDLIVSVCDGAHEELATSIPDWPAGRLHWSVPDPVQEGSDEAFDAAVVQLTGRVQRLADALADGPGGAEHAGEVPAETAAAVDACAEGTWTAEVAAGSAPGCATSG